MKRYTRNSSFPLVVGHQPEKIYVPDFAAENELYRKCGTMNIVDAGLMVAGMDEVASVELKSIDSHPIFETSGIDDETLAHGTLDRHLDFNEINESLEKDILKLRKNE